MTFAHIRSAAEHIARAGSITPHQLAAFDALWESMSETQKQQFTDGWRAEGSPAAPPPPAWLAPAEAIIKEFEGCRLQAYQDAVGVWTIGWGATRYAPPGGPVKRGDTINQAQADELLRRDLLDLRGPGLLSLFPMAPGWPPNQIAALVSWGFNVGLGAVEDSTLRKRILAGEDRVKVVREELPRWNKAGGRELPGLTRRRAAEIELFAGTPPLQQNGGFGNPLQVPWYAQMDSADRQQAARMCFSSSCAMLLQYLKPGTLTGPNGDDQYLRRVQQYGDTTDPTAQIRALSSYGVKAKFTKVAGWAILEDQIKKGIPVPCGYLHRGPVTAPSGSGHWLIAVGHDKENLIVHDPFGEADLVNGKTMGGVARFMKYSRKNFGPRWMVEGNLTGWAIIAER